MKLEISKNANPNYLAKVIKVSNIRKHSNADRLQIITIDGNNVIVDLNMKIGDVVVYFPVESCIESWFLRKYNQYRDKTLNADVNSACGFFDENGRVKALRLRDEPSCGIVFPIDKFTTDKDVEKYINKEFDTIDGNLICKKYIPAYIKTEGQGNKIHKKGLRNIKRLSKVIEEQFHFHIDTVHFGKNIHKFKSDDIIQLTAKLHGSSGILSRVLCKKNLTWYQKLFNKFGANIPDIDYDYLYSSRSVIKNANMNPDVKEGFYSKDIWKVQFDKYKDFLDKGMTIYGEIVGYVELTNKGIQSMNGKVYDYGCPEGTSEFYVYRITYTNPDGKVYEFSAKQVQDWCDEHGMKVVPEIFYGKFKEILSPELANMLFELENSIESSLEIKTDENGNKYSEPNESYRTKKSKYEEKVLEYLRNKYLEGDDPMCNNVLPFEGVVFRREKNQIDSYKFKSFRFLKGETDELDKGNVDMETQESVVEE